MRDSIIKITDISKAFNGVHALDGLSCKISENTITALIGPNGSGKTTLFNVMTGFLQPDSGEIMMGGKKISSKSPHSIARMGIGRTFQNIRLFPQMTVIDNVMLAKKYEKGDRFVHALFQTSTMKTEESLHLIKTKKLLDFVGLTEKECELAENLSHGQRRLLELARALALDPKIVLLDEPTAGLFPEMVEKMIDKIRQLKQSGKTILFIEHNMNVVMEVAEQIIVLNHGKKIAEGTPEEIKCNEHVIETYLAKKMR